MGKESFRGGDHRRRTSKPAAKIEQDAADAVKLWSAQAVSGSNRVYSGDRPQDFQERVETQKESAERDL